MKRVISVLLAVLVCFSLIPAFAQKKADDLWVFVLVVFELDSGEPVDSKTIAAPSAAQCDRRQEELRVLLEGGMKPGYAAAMSKCVEIVKPRFKKERDS